MENEKIRFFVLSKILRGPGFYAFISGGSGAHSGRPVDAPHKARQHKTMQNNKRQGKIQFPSRKDPSQLACELVKDDSKGCIASGLHAVR